MESGAACVDVLMAFNVLYLNFPGTARQTCRSSFKMSQSGSRHCWIKKGSVSRSADHP